MAVSYLTCMILVASIYHLPPRVLPSIQVVEGGQNNMIHHNENGTNDLGVMQINNLWLPALSRYTKLSTAIIQARLISVPCFNIAAAGAILQSYLIETNGNLLQAVGDYHSHTSTLNAAYQIQVMEAARSLFENIR